jgi:hypothetical protein
MHYFIRIPNEDAFFAKVYMYGITQHLVFMLVYTLVQAVREAWPHVASSKGPAQPGGPHKQEKHLHIRFPGWRKLPSMRIFAREWARVALYAWMFHALHALTAVSIYFGVWHSAESMTAFITFFKMRHGRSNDSPVTNRPVERSLDGHAVKHSPHAETHNITCDLANGMADPATPDSFMGWATFPAPRHDKRTDQDADEPSLSPGDVALFFEWTIPLTAISLAGMLIMFYAVKCCEPIPSLSPAEEQTGPQGLELTFWTSFIMSISTLTAPHVWIVGLLHQFDAVPASVTRALASEA